jgi:DNA-binding NtrC family response regulator
VFLIYGADKHALFCTAISEHLCMEQQVLIIEPSPDYFLLLQRTVNAASPGTQFHQAIDAGDALRLIGEYEPSVCIVDKTAGLENDAALLNVLHQDYPSTVVILLTDNSDSVNHSFHHEKVIHFRFNKTSDFENICDTVIKML